MGIYLNPGNELFGETLNSEIYIDKSMLIAKTNKVVRTQQKFVCVSPSGVARLTKLGLYDKI